MVRQGVLFIFAMVCCIYAIIAIEHDFVTAKSFTLGFQHFPRDLANVNE